MGPEARRYPLGPETGRLVVMTSRTGLGSKAGHDLTLEVTRWHGEAVVDRAAPGESSVTVDVEAGSLTVVEGTGGIKPLTASDRAEIENTMRRKILHTDRHPAITFTSSRVRNDGDSFRLDGDLTVVGVSHPVTVEGRLDDGRARGSATIVQSRYGIRPYSAFFGALKLRDEVEVRFDLDLVAGSA